jgi:hypothetical protein
MEKMSESEIAERIAAALDPGYWRALTQGQKSEHESSPASDPQIERSISTAIDDFRRCGVYHVRSAIGPDVIARLNHVIDAVVGAGWPGVFAFACDELWSFARLEPIRMLVAGVLGENARQISHVWTHIVKPGEQAGWTPHVDGPGDGRMTVWIALTDAGLGNGCMHAVLRDADTIEAVHQWVYAQDSLTKLNAQRLLQATKAMPTSAGDMIGWAFDILHWGGPVSVAAPGRRSLSLEYIGADIEPGPTETTLIAFDEPLLSHVNRMQSVASAILEYWKFEPTLIRYQDVANGILSASRR